jgi:hypothetical protein
LARSEYINVRNLFYFLLSGACDVIFVEQPDGSYRSTPFHVRFGQLQPSRQDGDSSTPSSVVDLTINGRRLSPNHVHIQLDKTGLVWLSKVVSSSNSVTTTEQLAAASRCLPMTANRAALLPASTAVRLPSGLAAVIGPAASQLITTCADQLLNGGAAGRPVSPLRTGFGVSTSRPSPPCAEITPKEQLIAVNLRYRTEQRTGLKNSLSLSREELVHFNLRRGLNQAIFTMTSGLKGCNFKKIIGVHRKEKVHEFPVSSRDVTNLTPPGQE